MRRSRYIQLPVALTVLIMGMVLTPNALALPELLGQAANAEFDGKQTTTGFTLETTKGEIISCPEVTIDGVQETDTLGSFHWHMTKCKSSGFACNTTPDAANVILWLGSYHYVFYKLGTGGELGVAVLMLPEELTIKCTALVTYKVRGVFLCPIIEVLTSTTTRELFCSQSKGVATQSTWWNDEGNGIAGKLEASKNGGSFIESGVELAASLIFGTTTSFMNE